MTSSTLKSANIGDWGEMQYRLHLEGIGTDDGPALLKGPTGDVEALCALGQLTDTGRLTTHLLGGRFRHLYVDQLGFMPKDLKNTDMMYLRATCVPRALESMQEAFWGMYPAEHRLNPFPNPPIVTRALADENLFPNEGNCRRFASLVRAYAKRTAVRWNSSDDMKFLNDRLGRYMPEASKRVAVDGSPRASGIMDTVNSVLAHGPEVYLPSEFSDAKVRAILDKVCVEEWFAGFKESREYRLLGIGSLMGDITARMVKSAELNGHASTTAPAADYTPVPPAQDGSEGIKMTLNGCHDTTLASVLASLGAFENGKWPPYTSHVAIELFRKSSLARSANQPGILSTATGWITSFFEAAVSGSSTTDPIGRKRLNKFSTTERAIIDGYYVRIRYNDEVVTIPGCGVEGSHLEGDKSFCTLVSNTPHNPHIFLLTTSSIVRI